MKVWLVFYSFYERLCIVAVFVEIHHSVQVVERVRSKKEQAWLAKYCDVCKRKIAKCEADSCERWG